VESSLDLLNTPSPSPSPSVSVSMVANQEEQKLETESNKSKSSTTTDDVLKRLINPIKLQQIVLEKVDWKLDLL
jgi:hypothetical protein